MNHSGTVQLGLRENWRQFALLVIVNAFVGGMIGLERSIFPQYASEVFGMESATAVLAFIASFGVSKALANYATGRLAGRYGRRNLLITGWMLALPVPFLLMNAPTWNWVIFANLLLGIHQGLTWSSTVVMKIDLVGERHRGLAMGLNEFAGYLAVGLVALLTALIAGHFGVTPYPFYLGILIAAGGLLLTALWVRDTGAHVAQESRDSEAAMLDNLFWQTTWRHRTLGSVTQAGLVNNLNDGMIWGLLPMLLLTLKFDSAQIGWIAGIYPAVWGIGQLFTGRMSDHYSKKWMLFAGMLLQGIAILLIPAASGFGAMAILASLLGAGTALVYPTFLSAIAGATHPRQRAESMGIFRFWRDMGYVFGALLSGLLADMLGLQAAVGAIGGLTLLSAFLIAVRMPAAALPERACIEAEAIREAIRQGLAVQIIELADADAPDRSPIPDAWRTTLRDLPSVLSKLNRQALIVTLSSGGGGASALAARFLRMRGLQARWLCGGTERFMSAVS